MTGRASTSVLLSAVPLYAIDRSLQAVGPALQLGDAPARGSRGEGRLHVRVEQHDLSLGHRDGLGAAQHACQDPTDRVGDGAPMLGAAQATWLVEAASRRQKWIDQAQSLNIYMAGASGKKLDDTYKLAWVRGLKTTYYLRTTSATQVEKSTVKAGSHNAVSSGLPSGGMGAHEATAPATMSATPATDVKFTAIDDVGCEACQ